MTPPISLETLVHLDPHIWPLALLAFLRVLSVFIWLPIFSDATVPKRLRIVLALSLVFCLWPTIEPTLSSYDHTLQWNPLRLAICTLREVFFGFAVGFASKMLSFTIHMASHLVGTGMGFQVASLYNPHSEQTESSYSVFKSWILIMALLTFQVHHIFLKGLNQSFINVPLGVPFSSKTSYLAVELLKESFSLGLQLSAPLILVQFLCSFILAFINKAIPQINVFVMNYPLSFLLSITVLFFSFSTFYAVLSNYGFSKERFFSEKMTVLFASP